MEALDTGALDAGALDTGALDAGAFDAGALEAGGVHVLDVPGTQLNCIPTTPIGTLGPDGELG